jgi:D-glycerate 3-kinase
MEEAEIARFVAHYERLTRWILAEMPARADWVVTLDTKRNPYL